MFRRLARWDCDGALARAREILVDRPEDVVAWNGIEECRRMRAELDEFVRDAPPKVPRRAQRDATLVEMPLDPVYLFVHGFIDGWATVDAIVDATGLPRSVALHALFALTQCGAVTLA